MQSNFLAALDRFRRGDMVIVGDDETQEPWLHRDRGH